MGDFGKKQVTETTLSKGKLPVQNRSLQFKIGELKHMMIYNFI